jgi:Zn-dependent protease with chaperone function
MPPPVQASEAARIIASLANSPATTAHTEICGAMDLIFNAVALAWIILFLWSGASKHLSHWAQKRSRSPFWSASLFWIVYQIAKWIVFLPISIYDGYWIPHRFGLSNLAIGAWLLESAKWLGVNTLIGAAIVGAMIVLIRKFPLRWTLIAPAALIPVIAFGIFAAPLMIDPLFNHFTEIPKSAPLHRELQPLLDKAGIGSAQVYIVNKSRQTSETNAYVTGLGGSARIVIWDTLLAKMPPDQVKAVVSHEIGHYAEHHVPIGFALTIIVLLVAFPMAKRIAEWMIGRFGRRWGVRRLDCPAAVPVLVLSFLLLTDIASPVTAMASRYIEHRADSYGIGLSQNRLATARAFVSLSSDNLWSTSPPLWIKCMEDHPSLGDRVEFALTGK